MKKPNHQRGPAGKHPAAPNPPQIQQPAPPRRVVDADDAERIADVKGIPAGSGHPTAPGQTIKTPFKHEPGKPGSQSARGDDEVVRHPQSLSSAAVMGYAS